MYKVRVSCEGIKAQDWPEAINDVTNEFASRWWHKVDDCSWDGDILTLTCINDYDHNGEALADEFSDTVAAYSPGSPGYKVSVVSVRKCDDNAA